MQSAIVRLKAGYRLIEKSQLRECEDSKSDPIRQTRENSKH